MVEACWAVFVCDASDEGWFCVSLLPYSSVRPGLRRGVCAMRFSVDVVQSYVVVIAKVWRSD